MVVGAAVELVARADRRPRRRRRREGGLSAVLRRRGSTKTPLFIVLSPLLGLVLGFLLMVLGLWMLPAQHARQGRPLLPRGCSSSRPRSTARPRRQRRAEDDGHHRGAALSRQGMPRPRRSHVPLWVVLVVPRRDGPRHARRAAGASCKTMGMRITKLKPVGGFCAETGGAITLFVATRARHPGLDDAHDHGRDRRRRLRHQPVERALGRRRPHRLGVGVHDPVRGADQRRDLRCPPRPRHVTGQPLGGAAPFALVGVGRGRCVSIPCSNTFQRRKPDLFAVHPWPLKELRAGRTHTVHGAWTTTLHSARRPQMPFRHERPRCSEPTG